jgi:hypothetical protein
VRVGKRGVGKVGAEQHQGFFPEAVRLKDKEK